MTGPATSRKLSLKKLTGYHVKNFLSDLVCRSLPVAGLFTVCGEFHLGYGGGNLVAVHPVFAPWSNTMGIRGSTSSTNVGRFEGCPDISKSFPHFEKCHSFRNVSMDSGKLRRVHEKWDVLEISLHMYECPDRFETPSHIYEEWRDIYNRQWAFIK
jgi:hypothetical protein